jgi:hypothetical protein
MRTVHSGVWRPADRAEDRYRYLPVDVPAGAGALTVTLEYQGGVLDLGCLDGAGRFRGWSGGARSTFTIAADHATPGYLPGLLDPGSWQVMVGLHRVPPDGVSWTVTAETGAAPRVVEPALGPPPPRPPARLLPALDGLTWLAGDLHAHTVHSDGALTVAELARLAAESGLDFLAVTDHNTVSHHAELPAAGEAAGVLLVPGQEVTTDRGHANVFGYVDWVDFRRPAAWWGAAGLMSVNHPLGGDCAWLHPVPVRPPLAEVWHSGWWDRTWGAPLAWLLAWGADTVPVGGSDFHSLAGSERLGRPTTWVACADRSVSAVLDGLARGRVAITESPDGPVLLRLGDEFVVLGAEGALLADMAGRRRLVGSDRARFPAGPGPHWLEDDRARVLAIAGSDDEPLRVP